MKPGYTVGWSPSTVGKLTRLWSDNPAIRREVTSAVNEIDAALRQAPGSAGIAAPGSKQGARFVVQPPISLLFLVSEDDRRVQVLDVKLWDE